MIRTGWKGIGMNKIVDEIGQYLQLGGFFNPEEMEPHKVSDLIMRARDELERLVTKCDRQAMVIRRMYVEHYPDQWFAWHGYGEKDRNGLPQYIEVVPAHGVGWTQVYEKTNRTISMEGS
jgi:hypothetical protein